MSDTERMIRHIAQAGFLSAAMRLLPDEAESLERIANRHRAEAALIAARIAREARKDNA
jgi:hypothetical protein